MTAAGAYRLAAVGDYPDSAGALEWSTLVAVAAHVACASMALTGGAAAGGAAPGVGEDATAAVCEAPEGGNTVAACTVRRGYGVVPA